LISRGQPSGSGQRARPSDDGTPETCRNLAIASPNTRPQAIGGFGRRSASYPTHRRGRIKLLDDDDDLAFGVPFAAMPQRLGHLTQPVPAVDDRSDLCRLAELNNRRQVLRTEPDGQQTYLLARGSSGKGPISRT
jgi:hypothetical protein